jgi:lipopolysaccharide/colanic/teichoic acid biosynthesis glycosyltransferase
MMSTEVKISPKSVIVPSDIGRYGVPQNPLTRVFDVALILLAAPYILFFFLLISILIMVDSNGGPLYRQTRIGKGGRRFQALKFRTMVMDADQILQRYLDESPELKAEWAATHKLKRDPRVTRVGAMLRKLSLDEMPQFWNILIGDMSLIGPRPIVDAEIERYGKCFELYIQARPGLTGLWQVSGRSDTSYQRRVELDEYYLLNRSLKLDLIILLKTVYVVLGRKGAY